MFTHVSGRRILGMKRLHMFQEEGYWEGNVYSCFRKKGIGKDMFTHVLGRWILMRKKTHYCESDLYYLIIPQLAY
jgi:hypothetical protein